ncbi:hypothetical protein DHEL01_v203727 [Diaporthe helianthi]|uniref:Extracellular serine-threonine rich protein n=1 Tax=Diaporthe helianthi TaxID=158607 RepID=A0A2P5I5U9_DIAHE|nr:hypothetical protein DHEL01_v203727 [Diaporthe helianthi]
MRFQSSGALASLLLFSRGAIGAVLAAPAHSNATFPIVDLADDARDPNLDPVEEDVSAAVPSATAVAANAGAAPPAPIANGTLPTPASEQLTTLTVLSTQVRTVISCAPTVTNCPADASSLSDMASTAPEQVSTVLVTDVVQLATTICPVTAAESISSSVISVAATGGITGTTITATQDLPGALPTGAQSPSGTGAVPAPQPSGSASVPPGSAAEVPSGSSAVPPQESSSPETAASQAPPAPTGALPPPPTNSTGVKPFPIGNSSIASVHEVTSTVYATNLYTVTSCAASVTNCPAGSSIATEIVPISTTVLTSTLASSELTSLSSVAAITGGAPEPTPVGEQTTLTVQVTHLHTVISCAPTVSNCPAATATKEIAEAVSSHGSSAVQPVVVTSIVGVTTTVCPVAEASSVSSAVGASMSSAIKTTTVSGSASFFIPSATSVQASASSSVAAVAGSSSTAVIVSVSPVVSVITITLSDGFERTSTSSFQEVSTITTVVAAPTPTVPVAENPAAETPAAVTPEPQTVHTTVLSTTIVQVPSVVTVTVSGIAQESSTVVESTSVHTSIVEPSLVVSNVVSTIYETITSQIPIETILTVTIGDQVLTSTISTAAAIQTPETTAPAQVSTVYVTVGSGSDTSIMTSTFTASEVVAKDTQTLTLTGSAGIVSTYTLTMSKATTVTQEAPKPTNQGNAASSCVPSTVTLISVSTLCARSGNACATATNLPLARF